jgi:hypothetical protein
MDAAPVCTAKAFDTFVDAKRAALWTRRDFDRLRVAPYRCRACSKFHIGEQSAHRSNNGAPARLQRLRSHGWTHFNPRRRA